MSAESDSLMGSLFAGLDPTAVKQASSWEFLKPWDEVQHKPRAINHFILYAQQMVEHVINCHEVACPLHEHELEWCTPPVFIRFLTNSTMTDAEWRVQMTQAFGPDSSDEVMACLELWKTHTEEDIYEDLRFIAFSGQYNCLLAVRKVTAESQRFPK